jgi:hypothetical protein
MRYRIDFYIGEIRRILTEQKAKDPGETRLLTVKIKGDIKLKNTFMSHKNVPK